MTAQAFPEAEKRQAVENARRLMVEDGYSQNKAADAAAEDLGVTGRTVKNWAVALKLPLGELSQEAAKRQTEVARETGRTYDLARRLELNDFLFERIREIAANARETNGLKDLALAFGILTDKRRLEEGQVTNRTESVTDVRQRLEDRLDELAARRALKAAS